MTIQIRRSLAFTVHPDKSKFIPVQYIAYLGFILNSVQMTITLEKSNKKKLCQEIIREALKMDKANALQQSNGNYDASVRLSNEANK